MSHPGSQSYGQGPLHAGVGAFFGNGIFHRVTGGRADIPQVEHGHHKLRHRCRDDRTDPLPAADRAAINVQLVDQSIHLRVSGNGIQPLGFRRFAEVGVQVAQHRPGRFQCLPVHQQNRSAVLSGALQLAVQRGDALVQHRETVVQPRFDGFTRPTGVFAKRRLTDRQRVTVAQPSGAECLSRRVMHELEVLQLVCERPGKALDQLFGLGLAWQMPWLSKSSEHLL